MVFQVRITALRVAHTLDNPCRHDGIFDGLLYFEFDIFRQVEVIANQGSRADEFLVQIANGIFAFGRLLAQLSLLEILRQLHPSLNIRPENND